MITADELKAVKIFGCLEESERQRLATKAADVRLNSGEWLIREGETPSFFVILEGELTLLKDILGLSREFREYAYKAGDFFGELPILLGREVLQCGGNGVV